MIHSNSSQNSHTKLEQSWQINHNYHDNVLDCPDIFHNGKRWSRHKISHLILKYIFQIERTPFVADVHTPVAVTGRTVFALGADFRKGVAVVVDELLAVPTASIRDVCRVQPGNEREQDDAHENQQQETFHGAW